MAQTKVTLKTNSDNVQLDVEFKHGTSIGANGEILYDCPMEIKDKADLRNYGITWDDCKTIRFGKSEKITVYFMKVESRELAEYQWRYLDTQHSRGFASVRCMIPGTRKPWVRCPDTTPCADCPHKKNRRPPVVSWNRLIDKGYEPVPSAPVDEQVFAKMEFEDIRKLMDAEDPRIAKAYIAKEREGRPVKEIAKMLRVSEPRVYQFVSRAKAIANKYQEENQYD